MMRLFVRVCVVLLCAGCTSAPNEGPSQSISDSAKMPPNYRALVARSVLQIGLSKEQLKSAKISQPFAKGGVFDAPIPAVCVSIDTVTIFGSASKAYYDFTVRNGRAERLTYGSAIFVSDCGLFSPFHEVAGR
jgi:hypothetical protein